MLYLISLLNRATSVALHRQTVWGSTYPDPWLARRMDTTGRAGAALAVERSQTLGQTAADADDLVGEKYGNMNAWGTL